MLYKYCAFSKHNATSWKQVVTKIGMYLFLKFYVYASKCVFSQMDIVQLQSKTCETLKKCQICLMFLQGAKNIYVMEERSLLFSPRGGKKK